MYVSMYVYMNIYVCVYIYIYVYIYTYILFVCKSRGTVFEMSFRYYFDYSRGVIRVYVHTYICIDTCVYMYVCINIYIYIHTMCM